MYKILERLPNPIHSNAIIGITVHGFIESLSAILRNKFNCRIENIHKHSNTALLGQTIASEKKEEKSSKEKT